MKKLIKIIILLLSIVFAVGVVSYLGFRIYISANSGDVLLRDDFYLNPQIVEVLDEKNAWFDLKEAEKVMYYLEEDDEMIKKMAIGEAWNDEIAEKIIENNKETYKYINRALTKDFFVNPSVQNLSLQDYNTNLLMETIAVRELNRLYLINAKSDLLQGKKNIGINKIAKSIDFGETLRDSSFGISMVDYLFGLGVAKTTYEFMENALPTLDITKEDVLFLHNKLELTKNHNELENIYRIEYFIMKNALNDIDLGDYIEVEAYDYPQFENLSHAFYFKKNMTKNDLANEFDKMIENSHRPCNDLVTSEKKLDIKNTSKFGNYFTENAIGKILVYVISDTNQKFQKKICETDDQVSSLQNQLESYSSQK